MPGSTILYRYFGNAAIRQDQSGAVGVEFSLLAFPFLMLIVGIFALGLVLFATISLDYATQKAARLIETGNIQGSGTTSSTFRTTMLCPLLPSALFNCSNIVVNLKSFTVTPGVYNASNYYNFVNSTQSWLIQPPLDNTQTSFCSGLANSYEVLEVLYPLPIYLGLLATSAQKVNGQMVIMSSVTFKNEPFSGGGPVAAGC